ncbi:MAG: DUF4412 domain-containing protein [Desulfobacteraceae bacterium]|nr:DUF4412 domain-containing protein [Desulfobacteraceae bacterium]MBC2757230.1 DUF4412 domain-containing protein [Desulfobacteraceae bacterium]
MKRILSLITLLIFGLLSVPGPSHADIYMKRKRHTDAVKIMGMDQPAENVVEEIWITKKGFRSDDPKSSVIMLPYEQKVIMIDHRKKTYMIRDLTVDAMQVRIKEGKDPEKTAAMKGMMKNIMKIEAVVRATDEKKKISSWNCKKYFLTLKTFMGEIENEVWATEDLKVDSALYDQLTSSMISVMPGMENSMKDVTSEIKKIKGIQVKTISTQNIMNQSRKTVTDLMEFKDKKAPKNVFEIPKGYTKETLP